MSKKAIEAVLNALRELPDSEQERVLSFVAGLKHESAPTRLRRSRRRTSTHLKRKNGLLVYTGKIQTSGSVVDWINADREDRLQHLARPAAE